MLTDAVLDLIFNYTQGTKHLYPDKCCYVRDLSLVLDFKPDTNNQLNPKEKSTTETCVGGVYGIQVIKSINIPKSVNELRPSLRITVISDTHCKHRQLGKLPTSDLLIHCGDVLMVIA